MMIQLRSAVVPDSRDEKIERIVEDELDDGEVEQLSTGLAHNVDVAQYLDLLGLLFVIQRVSNIIQGSFKRAFCVDMNIDRRAVGDFRASCNQDNACSLSRTG